MPAQSTTTSDRVLLTGISGFLGGHVALELLRQGYTVRGSVRSPDRAEKVRKTLVSHGADPDRLEFVALDLLADTGWEQAMSGVRYVQHVASPFVLEQPRDRNALIRPAVEGTRRALTTAFAAGVERVVVTSSIAAIVYGHEAEPPRTFTEADWSNLKSPRLTAYQESKTRAEQEAWRIADSFGARDRLAVINPGAILGPLLDDDPGTSGQLAIRLLDGTMPGTPKMTFSIVDVRDVAAAQVAAMTASEAAGRRHILADREMSLFEMAEAIRTGLDRSDIRTPRFELPTWLVRVVGLFDRQIRDNAVEIGQVRPVNGDQGRMLLRRPTIAGSKAVVATADSLLTQGLIKT